MVCPWCARHIEWYEKWIKTDGRVFHQSCNKDRERYLANVIGSWPKPAY